MDPGTIIVSFFVMLGMMALGVPIAVVMALTGAVGGVLLFGFPCDFEHG